MLMMFFLPADCFFLVMYSPALGFEVEVEVLGRLFFFLVMYSPGLGFEVEVEVEVLGRFRFVESGDSTKGGCLGLPLGENPSSCSYSRRYQNPSPLFWISCGP